MHKFRKNFRSMGLPQGFALSPLLSVMTLIVLDELESKGIKHILYCDDGLLYSDEEKDFMAIAQETLDKYNIGAYFSPEKSKFVKNNDVWLSKIKFCGLEYDPFKDSLSAATRNGATLKLEIGAIGMFSDNLLDRPSLPDIVEHSYLEWKTTNEKFFKYYEAIYLIDQLGED
ncbi:MAG TPA: reverse transcriptase domain-containing protein [Methylomirabilota bacterium]|nr:reverse transcriptase domain-containing protein [Methylomirabilota bacterium]